MMAHAHRITAAFNARVRRAVAELPGNPGRVSVARFGEVWATRCERPDAPAWMNLATPLLPTDVGVLPELLEWYGERRPIIEVTPQQDGEVVARALAEHGAAATHPLDILRGRAGAPGPGRGDVSVELVAHDDAMLFARTLLGGHVESFWDHEAEGLASLVGGESVRCYLARVDGTPAAGAILTVDDGIAYLANASALPAFRNRGCHGALLAARLRDATELGCETVIALAAVGTTSHRNMERAGLHILVTLNQWTFASAASPATSQRAFSGEPPSTSGARSD
jgi:GNAT acetyltransferase-like protein